MSDITIPPEAITRDADGRTTAGQEHWYDNICPACNGKQWRAVKDIWLGPGVYEVRCYTCNGFGWIDEEHPVRP